MRLENNASFAAQGHGHQLGSHVRASARAENRLDETRTDALVPQPETGKIGCVHRPYCGRLSPSACVR
jgi:hypothetical protein